MNNIWNALPTPIMCLAPMEGVTDTVFRQLLLDIGKPDLMFTEFTSVDGLFSRGYEHVRHRLQFLPIEQPLIAQIWGLKPENYAQAVPLLIDSGFVGIDINMGCPDKNVIKKGACSALVNNRSLAQEIIQATKTALQGRIPLSVKIRIGYDSYVTEDWVSFLLAQGIDALIIHGRTTRELSLVPANWEEIAKAVKIRDQLKLSTKIIGNGDVESLADAHAKVATYNVDGVMIGRGIFKDPWLFNPHESIITKTPQQKIDTMMKHVRLFDEVWQDQKHFDILKRYFKIYINGFENASDLRTQLMATKNRGDVEVIIAQYTKQSVSTSI